MNIAEFFVKLGIKGDQQAKKQLTGVFDGLSEVKSMSLQTKASILAVVYGLQHMMSQAMNSGTELSNFMALTDEKTGKRIQQYEYVAKQAGAAAGAVKSTFLGIQNSIAAMDLGEGPVKGLEQISMTLEKLGGTKIDPSLIRDPMYLIDRFAEFAKLTKDNPGISNNLLRKVGFGDEMIAAARKNAFELRKIMSAPYLSDSQINSLYKADMMWENMGEQMKMSFAQFSAKDGSKLTKNILDITKAFIGLADVLLQIADRLKVFEIIGHTLDLLTTFLRMTRVGIDDMTGDHKKSDNAKIFGKGSTMAKVLDWRDDLDNAFKKKFIPKVMPASYGSAKGGVEGTNVTIHNTFQGQHPDPARVNKDFKKSVQQAGAYMQSKTGVK